MATTVYERENCVGESGYCDKSNIRPQLVMQHLLRDKLQENVAQITQS